MKRFVLQIFLFVALVIVALPSLAATGRVAGKVINKTTGKPVAGLSVKLIRIGPDRRDVTVATATSGAQGQFSFPTFTASNQQIFMAQTSFQGQRFEQVSFDGTGHLKEMTGIEVDPNKVELAVYDKSAKMPGFEFVVHHLAITREERILKVVVRIVAQQMSNWVYDGSAGPAKIKLYVPPGARDVTLDPKIKDGKIEKEGENYNFVFAKRVLLPQGMQRPASILVNYTLDWPRSAPWNRKIDLTQPVSYPTKFFFVARPPGDKDLKLVAPLLGGDEQQDITNDKQEKVTKIVNAIGMPMVEKPVLMPGQTVAISLEQPLNPLVWAFVMFVGALIAIVPLVLRTSGRKAESGDYQEDDKNPGNLLEPAYRADVLGETFRSPSGNSAPSGGAQKLILAIAELDEEFAAGGLDEKTYQNRRAAWKKELVELLDEGQSATKASSKSKR